jgi:hypothetical protein
VKIGMPFITSLLWLQRFGDPPEQTIWYVLHKLFSMTTLEGCKLHKQTINMVIVALVLSNPTLRGKRFELNFQNKQQKQINTSVITPYLLEDHGTVAGCQMATATSSLPISL